MKVKNLEIENFKLFDKKFSEISDIAEADIVILNGPNGYGKTSIFDAIEFALTGKIKRINTYSSELGVNKNSAYDNKILIADETREAYINLHLEYEGNIIEIQRIYIPTSKISPNVKKASKENNPYNIFDNFKIKLIINKEEIVEQDAINKKLAEYNLNDIEDFYDKCCFLSQDEHLEFLKAANKEKATALEFLFKIPYDQQNEINKVDKLINSLENNNKVNNIGYITKLNKKVEEEIKPEINRLEGSLKKTNTSTVQKSDNKSLFPEKSIYWDKESMSISAEQYDRAIEEIEKLEYFAKHMENCFDFLYNEPYKKIMVQFDGGDITKNNSLEYAYRYYSLLKNEETIELKYNQQHKYAKLKENIEKRELDNINWKFIFDENILDESVIKSIKEKLDEVAEIKKTQGVISKVISNITKTRTTLIDYVSQAMNQSVIDDKICPLCGAPYEKREKLKKEIKKETDTLQFLCDDSGNKIGNTIDVLYKDYFNDVLKNISNKLISTISENTYKKLQEVKKNKINISKIKELLNRMDIELPEKYEEDIVKIEKGYEELRKIINNKLKNIPQDVELQLEDKDFIHEYENYYDKNEKCFKSITGDMLSVKKSYVKISFYNSEMKALNEKRTELTKVQDRINRLKKILGQLSNYRDAIQEGIKAYKKKIIQDIEPILYVYTAKILQQKFNGKSIFISTNEKMDNIRFINSVDDKQDILYTMSSGQLATVSLSFLLCMNQVYANQALPILLIDDPIQTIDDVNMVGLVDILRNEFMDRQIFISTHEQKFEWYLKYKYEKANKTIKPFNMKNLMLK
jgi:DNA repair exonuclease SbcCD ATPase subunit